jgi:hypothetical protein
VKTKRLVQPSARAAAACSASCVISPSKSARSSPGKNAAASRMTRRSSPGVRAYLLRGTFPRNSDGTRIMASSGRSRNPVGHLLPGRSRRAASSSLPSSALIVSVSSMLIA